MSEKLAEHKSHRGRRIGATAAEMPVALWLMIIMAFPLLILATSSLRFALFWNASREAAQRAAQCQTFQDDSAVGQSSVNVADFWAAKATNAWGGIPLTNPPNVYIVQTNVNSGTRTVFPSRTKLVNVADTENCIYDIQVELNGNIEPLITFPGATMLGNVPGLTGPYPVVVQSQYNCEVPQGLNK